MKNLNQTFTKLFFVHCFAIIIGGHFVIMAQDKQPPAGRRSFAEIVNMPVVYQLPGMDRAQIKKDITYKSNGGGGELKLDVYLPPQIKKGEKLPVVFFIHGGTPLETRPKDWGVFASWGKLVAASGMIGVVFTHRMGFPKPEFATAEADLTDAIDYVRAHAESFSADKDRIALVAFSAGAPLLSLPMREKPPFVRGLVSFYGFLDVQQSAMHLQTVKDNEILKKYSPLTYLAQIPANLPPILIARAGRDEIPGLNDAANRFVETALINNIGIEVLNHPAGVHGFDNQTDDARSRGIIRRALEFLRSNVGLPETGSNR